MTNKKWFILVNQQVKGPLKTEEVELKLNDAPTAVIWGRGFNEWVGATEWRKLLANPELANLQEAPVTWQYRQNQQIFGPFSFENLVIELKKQPHISDVELLSSQGSEWQSIFTVESVADELGISRRVHPRVPIMGTFENEPGQTPFKHSVVTISQGGMGLSDAFGFKIGDRMKGIMKSPHIFLPVHCSCELVFVGSDGYVGLRFSGLPHEAHSAIVEYVRKFSEHNAGFQSYSDRN